MRRGTSTSPPPRAGPASASSLARVLLGGISLDLDTNAALDTADQRAGLILLACMLLSFGFIRFSTRMIRAQVSWWPGNVSPGGLHIHHLVFGIVLVLFSGFVSFAVQPGSPWFEID